MTSLVPSNNIYGDDYSSDSYHARRESGGTGKVSEGENRTHDEAGFQTPSLLYGGTVRTPALSDGAARVGEAKAEQAAR